MKSQKKHITPPRLAEKLLLWLIKDELAEEVLGDLDEKFYSTAENIQLEKQGGTIGFRSLTTCVLLLLKTQLSKT